MKKLTNSDKIKKLLDYGCHVEVEYKQKPIKDKTFVKTVLYYNELQKEFITDEGVRYSDFDDWDIVSITPIYFKPPYKVGDKVDVSEEYGGHKNQEITQDLAGELHLSPCNRWVAYWAISPSIEEEEVETSVCACGNKKCGLEEGTGGGGAAGTYIGQGVDMPSPNNRGGGSSGLYSKPKIEKLTYELEEETKPTEVPEAIVIDKINELIDYINDSKE